MKKPMRGLWPMFQFLHKQEMKMLKSGITGLSAWGLNSNLRRVPTKPPSLPSFLGSCSSPVLAPYLAFPVLAHPHKSLFSTAFSHFYFSEHPVFYKCIGVVKSKHHTPADQLVPFQRLIPSKSEMGEATQNTESSSSVQKNV